MWEWDQIQTQGKPSYTTIWCDAPGTNSRKAELHHHTPPPYGVMHQVQTQGKPSYTTILCDAPGTNSREAQLHHHIDYKRYDCTAWVLLYIRGLWRCWFAKMDLVNFLIVCDIIEYLLFSSGQCFCGGKNCWRNWTKKVIKSQKIRGNNMRLFICDISLRFKICQDLEKS